MSGEPITLEFIGRTMSEFKGRIGISQSMIGRRLDDPTERVEELETGRSRFTP